MIVLIILFFLIAFFLFVGASLRMSDKEFIEETSKQLGEAAEWWYSKNKKQ